MRTICSYQSWIYIAIRESIYRFNVNETSGFHEFKLSEGNTSGGIIHVITVSEDGNFLYAGYSNKIVCCWETSTGILKGKHLNKKRPTGLVYGRFYFNDSDNQISFSEECSGSNYRDVLLIGDKSGEISAVDHFMTKEPVLCGAHTTSVITDMIMHQKLNLFVACDRDGMELYDVA